MPFMLTSSYLSGLLSADEAGTALSSPDLTFVTCPDGAFDVLVRATTGVSNNHWSEVMLKTISEERA